MNGSESKGINCDHVHNCKFTAITRERGERERGRRERARGETERERDYCKYSII